ncbi:protein MFI-like [Gigantopelta aegis]|uniref:protein MFI-like n=1 Tax=Gigantopelta aegis TaxID=1735272 RepID=UPI001B8893A7|nr:protein MFI-like [Gigantopelta aegis]
MQKLNQKDLLKLLDAPEIHLADGPRTLAKTLASGPKNNRLKLIRENDNSEKATIAAAIEIQRVWRGFRIRLNIAKTKGMIVSTTAVYGNSTITADRDKALEEFGDPLNRHDQQDGKSDYSDNVEDDKHSDHESKKEPVTLEDSVPDFIDASDKVEDVMELSSHAAEGTRTDRSVDPLSKTDAVIIIQRSWRRHIDIQVYRYYRDLINFKTRGDPMLMLRCINPNEAKLLDPAAGIHIRFRLAGQRFPPMTFRLLYVFKQTTTKDTHSKKRQVVDPTSTEGWYQRIDNNGWRLVSDRLISHIMSDTVTWETSQKKYDFHHDRLQRKQDVDRRRKQKKINWMKKMYKDGMLKARSKDMETVKLIEGAAAGMVATVDNLGPEALEEWEVDELLEWTTSLNFDDYLVAWKDIATSSNSEKKIVDRLQVMTSSMDPYEMTLSTGPSRFQSTRQSHNTPVSSSVSNKHWVTVG